VVILLIKLKLFFIEKEIALTLSDERARRSTGPCASRWHPTDPKIASVISSMHPIHLSNT